MSRLDNARKFRKEFEANKKASQKLLRQDQLTAEELLELIDVFDDWKVGEKLIPSDKRKYNEKLYIVNVGQGHTTQSDWTPDVVPALFKKIVPDNVIREIPDPITAEQKFALGEKGTWKGKIYESIIANNVWTPTAHPQGWKLV